MPITIGSNIAALRAERRLNQGSETLSRVYERLSSGQRINRASDDAAGLAVSASLNATARIFSQSVRNANDGLSALSIMEGALSQLSGLVTRIVELAEQSANESYSSTQRSALDREAQTLSSEYSRIVNTTTFNGRALLDPNNDRLTLQVGADGSINSILSLSTPALSICTRGTGTFQAGKAVATGIASSSTGFSSADFDKNGFEDLLFFSNGGGNAILLNNGNGTFTTVSLPYSGAGTGARSFSVDADEDGNIDALYVSGANLVVKLGNGNGTFKAAQSYAAQTSGGTPQWFTMGDTNQDGNEDFISYENGFGIRTLLGNSDGSFSAPVSTNIAISNQGMAAGDLNGDGIVDLALTENVTGAANIFLGVGDGTFTSGVSYAFGGVRSPQLIDVDGDGNLDLIGGTANTTFYVGLGNGNGSFKSARSNTTLDQGFDNYQLFVSDFNSDGAADVEILAGDVGAIAIHLNNGDGTFSGSTSITNASGRFFAYAADLTGDGVQDLVTGANSSIVTIFTGTSVTESALPTFSLRTASASRSALDSMHAELDSISAELGKIGAMQSRLSSSIDNTLSLRENYQAAAARIVDADIAADAADMTKSQILQQAAAAVLSQANQQPALALTLLRS